MRKGRCRKRSFVGIDCIENCMHCIRFFHTTEGWANHQDGNVDITWRGTGIRKGFQISPRSDSQRRRQHSKQARTDSVDLSSQKFPNEFPFFEQRGGRFPYRGIAMSSRKEFWDKYDGNCILESDTYGGGEL